jgi:hypothetical protein
MKQVHIHRAILVMFFGFVGCGPKQASETPAEATAAAAPLPATWKEVHGKDQKAEFMKQKIVPVMGPLFQAYDAKAYGDFDCATCHGPDYKNPKRYLAELTFKDGKFEECADEAALCQFMGEKVVPEMAQAMGMPAYNPETHTGFGCGNCHTVAMQ